MPTAASGAAREEHDYLSCIKRAPCWVARSWHPPDHKLAVGEVQALLPRGCGQQQPKL